MNILTKILCFFGFHEWDGHSDPSYPAPRCVFCKKWHHADRFNENGEKP